VPTNVVLFADGSELDPTAFELSDERGGSIPIGVRAVAAGGFDIEPSAELAPYQTYLLTVPGAREGVINSITFTTGGGPGAVPDTLAAPHWNPVLVSREFGSCGMLYSVCTGARAAPDAMLEGRIGRESLGVQPDGASMMRTFGGDVLDGECVTIRARDIRGHRSDPVTICSDTLQRYDAGVGPDGEPTSLDCDAVISRFAGAEQHHDDGVSPPPVELGSTPAPTEVVGAERTGGGGGCAFSTGAPGAAASWLALAGALAALARRRRADLG